MDCGCPDGRGKEGGVQDALGRVSPEEGGEAPGKSLPSQCREERL